LDRFFYTNGTHGATATCQEYIDFAAKMVLMASLVEGWNVGWEDWINMEKRCLIYNCLS
jgi:hypothetical protein